jgi:hypothetical protein
MTVKLIDDSEHSFVVDDSQSTRKISDKLGEYLQLGKDGEQFCLCYPGSTIKKRVTFLLSFFLLSISFIHLQYPINLNSIMVRRRFIFT